MSEIADNEFRDAVAEFVGTFETVFRYDWLYTRVMFRDVAEGATFVEPGLPDEHDDWACRGELLEKYRQLVRIMQDRGIEPIFPIPLERIVPGFTGRVW